VLMTARRYPSGDLRASLPQDIREEISEMRHSPRAERALPGREYLRERRTCVTSTPSRSSANSAGVSVTEDAPSLPSTWDQALP
jgi:hypothetical protein